MSVSVLILTLNEEANIAACLDSVAWSDDIVILDSFSSDGTESIATAYGARFLQRVFDNYASQRGFGLNAIVYKYPWVLMLDADERVTPELAAEIRTLMAEDSGDVVMYRFRRKDYFFGRWIRRSSGYPTWFGRLVRWGRVRVEREVNEEYIADGKVGLLQEHVIHYPFNKGMAYWIDKHNHYSSMEAQIKIDPELAKRLRWMDLLSTDPAQRRIALKAIIYSVPARPVFVFVLLYLARGGILDGKAGLVFCLLRASYEFMIDCKVLELQLKKQGLPL
jgi:hypothetical protein